MKTTDVRFEVRGGRPGTGQGLFARALFRKGDFILEYTGEKISSKLADELPSRYLFEIDERWTIDAEHNEGLARYINHACEPNTEAEIERGRINIYAARDIRPGEELTINYGEEYFDEFIGPVGCKCPACGPVLV